jgi:excisionase family DNA binding protein
MAHPELLSVAQVAQRLGVSRQRVHRLITEGQLRAIQLGRYRYIEAAEVDRYLTLPKGRPYAQRSTARSDSIDK